MLRGVWAAAPALLLAMTLPMCGHAFEIKPLAFSLRGAEARDVNRTQVTYRDRTDPEACQGDLVAYVKSEAQQPIHEIITRDAYLNVKARRLSPERAIELRHRESKAVWAKPILSGVLWNDDPQWMLRKLSTGAPLAFKNLMEAGKRSPASPDPTIRSHYGDLQFLHSMRSRGEDVKSARENIRNWVLESMKVATGVTSARTELAKSAFGRYFPDRRRCRFANESGTRPCEVADVFDEPGNFRTKTADGLWVVSERNIRELALGSALHVIQDAHSTSHTSYPIPGADGLLELHTYDDQNRHTHCIGDAALLQNWYRVEAAVIASEELVDIWDTQDRDDVVRRVDALLARLRLIAEPVARAP